MNHYYGREFTAACRLLRGLYQQDPADKLAELYLHRAVALIKRGVPPNWEGVEVIDAK
jgi:hypothetical protein